MKFLKFNALRVRLMLIFSLAFLLLLVLLIGITRVYFPSYYERTNRQHMSARTQAFLRNPDNESLQQRITTLERHTGGKVTIYSRDLELAMTEIVPSEKDSVGPFQGPSRQTMQEDPGSMVPEALNPGANRTDLENIYERALEGGGKGYFFTDEVMLYYTLIMPKGELVILSKQTGYVDEAQTMFDAFILRAAAIVYIVGMVMVYFITRQLTKPIMEMEKITGQMADQDFSELLSPKGAYETRSLMTSINTMSGQLAETISRLNDSNEQLERELSKERSLEKMRRQFVSDVSHELKNPLAMIMAYTDGLIQEIPATREARQDYYGIIMDESERMSKLVKDLLDLSGYESGTFTITRETFRVNDLIDDAIERFSYVMDEKTVTVAYNPREDYVIKADRLRISQVIINILSNAFKHVNDRGTIRILLEKEGQGLKMIFANTGRLIPESALEDIWNSFYQVNTESKGNGLGLAIVRSIINLHGGSCRAYVEKGFNCFEIVIG